MDAIDRTILTVLQTDGRATLAKLAEATGLSISAIQGRMHKLEASHTIEGYRAVISPDKLGLMFSALIEITPLDPSAPDDLPERLESIPEIEACYSVAGDASYVLFARVAAPIDMEALLNRLRTEGEVRTRTTAVLSIPFEGRTYIPAERDQ
ncbi:MAG TPA: Lrp/AsnC family transcriptional regulator [Pseudoclavibacter sp.]|nr:Lrp/AsnC family transcriptional regulator [Pseudoclavibacter sp.]